MTRSEQLLQQAFGVEAMFQFFKDKVEGQKKVVAEALKDRRSFGMFEDCGDSYHAAYDREAACLSTMVEMMVSTEKYMKKLRHEARETSNAA